MSDIAIIGCGRIACLLEQDALRYKPCTHLGALRYWQKRDRGLKMAAFCDSDVARALGAAHFMGTKKPFVTSDYREVIGLRPDVLVIASNTDSHSKILTAAVRAGIRRVVLEKPVAFSAAEAAKLRRTLAKSKSVVWPNYERRYHPKYIRLKRIVERETKHASYRGFFAAGGRSLYANSGNGDEGVLLHDTTHLLDLAQFLFGPVRSRKTIAERRRHVLLLQHESGVIGTLETALSVGAFHLELELHLSKERILVGNGFLSRERIAASPHYKALKSYSTPIRETDKPFPVSKNPFVHLYREALYGKPTKAHFLEALENVEILSTPHVPPNRGD